MKDYTSAYRSFEIALRSNSIANERWTEVRIGDVFLLFHRSGEPANAALVAVKDKKNVYYHKNYITMVQHDVVANWYGKNHTVEEVLFTEIIFHLNRLLGEQANEYMEPIMKEAFVRNGDTTSSG